MIDSVSVETRVALGHAPAGLGEAVAEAALAHALGNEVQRAYQRGDLLEKRRRLMEAHRWPLFGMGVLTGYLGAAPSLLWAMSALTLVFAPVLILVSIWLYTLVFAFSALWFAHYLLAALRELRNGCLILTFVKS